MAGNGGAPPLASARAGRGPKQEGGGPGSPALKRRAIEKLAYRSTYSVDDHKRRAIESGNEYKIFPRTVVIGKWEFGIGN